MSNSSTIIIFILEYLLIPLGQVSIIIFGVMAIFLVIKYRSLSFFNDATKKEIFLLKSGGYGFIIIGSISVILAIVSS